MAIKDAKNKAENADSKPAERAPETPDDTKAGDEHRPREIGGRGGLDPTRYGDWEKAGRCIDF